MLVVDAHNHAAWLGFSIDEHVADMDARGIGVTWLLTWEAPEAEIPPYYADILPSRRDGLPLADAVEAARRHPGRFVLGYCPDPRRPDALDRLEAAIGRHGVRTCGEWKLRMEFDDPRNLRLLRFCADRGLPVTVHLTYSRRDPARPEAADYWYGGSMEALERALQAVPGLTLIGHGPGFWANISGDGKHLTDHNPTGPVLRGGAVVRLMRRHAGLYADLSGRSAATPWRATAASAGSSPSSSPTGSCCPGRVRRRLQPDARRPGASARVPGEDHGRQRRAAGAAGSGKLTR